MSRKHVQPFQSSDDDWRKDAACHGKDARLFDAENARDTVEMVKEEFCDRCPVRHECLAFGRYIKGDGIWGGVILEDGRASSGRRQKSVIAAASK